MPTNPQSHAIVALLPRVACIFGLTTVAESVKNDAIRSALAAIGVDYAQGFGVARPVSVDDRAMACASAANRKISWMTEPRFLSRPSLAAAVTTLALLSASTGARADDTLEPEVPALRLSGFGTVGALKTTRPDGWGLRREASQGAHDDDRLRLDVDSRLGVQAEWSVQPQWELEGQVVLKPRSRDASLQENVTAAFAAFHPSPEWTIRAGRTSPDVFLLADVRNVGFSYPWVRPPVDFYGWIPLTTADGIDASRHWDLDSGRVVAKVFAGRSSVTLGSNDGGADSKADVNRFFGTTVTAESGALTAKLTLAHAVTRTSQTADLPALRRLLTTLSGLPFPVVAQQAAQLEQALPGGEYVVRYAALSLAWDRGPWLVQAEVSRILGNFSPTNAWYGYSSATYRLGAFSWYGMAGRAKSTYTPLPDANWTATLAPVLGAAGAAQAQGAAQAIATSYNLFRADERTLSAGVRWDFSARTDLKFEFDSIQTASNGGGLWSNNTFGAHRANVLSMALDFVF